MKKALFLFAAVLSMSFLTPTADATVNTTGKKATSQFLTVMGSFPYQGYTIGYVFNLTSNKLDELYVENSMGQQVPISSWTGSITGNINTLVVTFSNVYILLSPFTELGPINYQS